MRLIVAGSRTFQDRQKVFDVLDYYHSIYGFTTILSGMATGPDLFGKEWAESHGIPVLEFPAEWDRYKNAAGIIRHLRIANEADYLIAFYDGTSTGTKDMISKMRDRTLLVYKMEKEGPLDL